VFNFYYAGALLAVNTFGFEILAIILSLICMEEHFPTSTAMVKLFKSEAEAAGEAEWHPMQNNTEAIAGAKAGDTGGKEGEVVKEQEAGKVEIVLNICSNNSNQGASIGTTPYHIGWQDILLTLFIRR